MEALVGLIPNSGIGPLAHCQCGHHQVSCEEAGPATYPICCPVIPNLDLGQTEVTKLSHVVDNKIELKWRVEGAGPHWGVLLALKGQKMGTVRDISACLQSKRPVILAN